jgi:hypothetical protein
MHRGAIKVGTLVFVPDDPSAVSCTGLVASKVGTNDNASGTLETTTRSPPRTGCNGSILSVLLLNDFAATPSK